VLEVEQQSKLLNRYLAQGQQLTVRCPQPNCGAENIRGAQYCEKCGLPLTGAATYAPRYRIKEAASLDPVRTEYTLVELKLTHANLILPREAFEEQTSEGTRYYVVSDEPAWQTAEQVNTPQELPLVLSWGIGLAEGLAYLHSQHIVLQESASRQIALIGKTAQWTDLDTAREIPLEEWQQNGTQRIAQDVRQLAALLYRLTTGLAQYDPAIKLMTPKANMVFAQALGEMGYATAGELAAALRDVEMGVRHPGGVDVHVARLSNVGQQRDLDEDSILTLELGQVYRSVSSPLGVYAVADGMGGHEGGDVASRLAIRTLARRAVSDVLIPALADNASPVDYEAWLKSAAQEANQVVYDRRKASGNDMGTTLVMAVVTGNTGYIAHVGDSRAYLITKGTITQLTRDHSLVERLVATGQIKLEEAAAHPQRNVIYKCMGDKPRLEPDISQQIFAPGDVLLLCCDGLNTEVSDADIAQIVTEAPSLPEASRRLIQAANDAGGDDNISVVLIGIQAVE
jgi:serine/threonine protein phosphatase PrpC